MSPTCPRTAGPAVPTNIFFLRLLRAKPSAPRRLTAPHSEFHSSRGTGRNGLSLLAQDHGLVAGAGIRAVEAEAAQFTNEVAPV
jgi:hypothetical protein